MHPTLLFHASATAFHRRTKLSYYHFFVVVLILFQVRQVVYAGHIGQAFSFDGVDDRVVIDDSPSLALTESMTIEAWVNARYTVMN